MSVIFEHPIHRGGRRAPVAKRLHLAVAVGVAARAPAVSAAMAPADNPAAPTARWELGPTGLRLRWQATAGPSPDRNNGGKP